MITESLWIVWRVLLRKIIFVKHYTATERGTPLKFYTWRHLLRLVELALVVLIYYLIQSIHHSPSLFSSLFPYFVVYDHMKGVSETPESVDLNPCHISHYASHVISVMG
jgi:hypothetical protein